MRLQAGTKGFTAASFYPLGDVDVFSFKIAVPGTSISVATSDGMGGCPLGAQTLVRILDGSSNVIAQRRRLQRRVQLRHQPTPRRLLRWPRVGTYYVHVESATLGHVSPSTSSTSTCRTPSPCGDSIVEVGLWRAVRPRRVERRRGDGCSATCQLLAGSSLNETEPNDTRPRRTISAVTRARWAAPPGGDVDWYSVDVTVAGPPSRRDRRRVRRVPARVRLDPLAGRPGGAGWSSDDGGGATRARRLRRKQTRQPRTCRSGIYGRRFRGSAGLPQPSTSSSQGAPAGLRRRHRAEPPEQCDPAQPTPRAPARATSPATTSPRRSPTTHRRWRTRSARTPGLSGPSGRRAIRTTSASRSPGPARWCSCR